MSRGARGRQEQHARASLFLVSPHQTAWLRFNATFSEDEWRWSFLIRSIERQQCRELSQQVEARMQLV